MRHFWEGFLKRADDPLSQWMRLEAEEGERVKKKKDVQVEASEASRDYPFESYRGGFYP